jgi:acetyltransferase-like isoleucine patch superfamily enzyme
MIILFKKIKNFGVRRAFLLLTTRSILQIKVLIYEIVFSDNKPVFRRTKILQPTQFVGRGLIELSGTHLGVWPSPNLFSGISYFEARSQDAVLKVGCGTHINNNSTIIVDRTTVTIGQNCLIGPNFFATDSDFHGLQLENRTNGVYECEPVIIEDNVFIGEGVKVLKGVKIGSGAVVGCGSLVTKDVAPNSVVAGVPAKKIADINL